MPNDAPSSLRSLLPAASSRIRPLRILAWLVAILVVFSIGGFLALPLLLKPIIETRLSTALARKVTVERLQINPFAGSATLTDVTVGERGDGPPLLTLGEIYANGEAASLLRWAPVISELKLTRPAIRLVRNADKSYNISDLIDQAMAAPDGPPPRFSITNIRVIDGRVDFDDRPLRQQHEITGIQIGIPLLSSLPTQTEIKVDPTFSATVNGRPVAITGETRPFKDTHETVLHWDLTRLSLPRYLDYLPLKLPFQIKDGTLDAKLDLTFIGRGSNPPQLTLAGTTRLAQLVLNERNGTPLLKVPSLAVAIDRLDLIEGGAEIRSIAVDGAQLDLRRAASGEVNLATLLPPDAAPSTPGKPYPFRIANLTLDHGTFRVADEAVSPAYVSTLKDLKLEAANLTNAANQKATVALAFVTDAGERAISGGSATTGPGWLLEGRLQRPIRSEDRAGR